MSDLVLSIDELKGVSRAAQPARIARWLRENGFTYKLALDGYPVVSRTHFERVMGGATGRMRTEQNYVPPVNGRHGPSPH